MNADASLNAAMTDAKAIVLAIFNRFGDGIVAATVCNEFIKRWSGNGRQFCIVTSKQLFPYVRVLCPDARVISLHKNNPFAWLRLKFLEKFVYGGFDVGLNPYCFAKESRKIIGLAKWSRVYQHSDDDFMTNYYDRARAYLALELQGDFLSSDFPSTAPGRILVTPESSELRRSLTDSQLKHLLAQLASRWPQATIVVAAEKKLDLGNSNRCITQFFLHRNQNASELFLREIRNAELVVSVDSGPLHIATAMRKPVIGLFSFMIPGTVLNRLAPAYILRDASLTTTYCEVHKCTVPECMNALNLSDAAAPNVPMTTRRIERVSCPLRK